jgi:hypothetical protein
MSDNEFDTIQRCPHDKENPYAMISRDLIRDKSLSPECRWLLIYLLSNDGKWIVKTSQLRSHLDGYMGRDKILAKIKEAIEAGYMKREEYKVNNLNRSRYFVSETPKFKKCFRRPEIQDPENGDPENQGPLKNKQSSSYEEEKEEQYKKGSAPPPSADAEGLFDLFLSKLKERNPEFKDPNRAKWLLDMDRLLRIDKRSVEKTREIIIWASTHKWFKNACLSPEKLRKDYDSMLMQMEAGKEEETITKNRQFALSMKEKYPERLKALFFDKNFVGNRTTGKEIPFKLPGEQFKEVFITLFGGQYVR